MNELTVEPTPRTRRREVTVLGSTRVTSKGQITIPKAVRERMGIRPGDEIEFVDDEIGWIRVRRDPRVFYEALEYYRGYLKHLEGQDVDELIEEMRGR